MRTWILLALVGLAGCGTLVDDVLPPSSASPDGGGGLMCASDDPCICTPCTSSDQCAPGLTCVQGRRRSENCADNRYVCLSGP